MKRRWVYTLRDPSNGALVAQGTSKEIEEKGFCSAAYLDVKRRKGENRCCGFDLAYEKEPEQAAQQAAKDCFVSRQKRIVYTLFDEDGQQLGRGTSHQLAEMGLVSSAGVVPKMWRDGHGLRKWGIARIEREVEIMEITSHKTKVETPAARIGGLRRVKDPVRLDWDVHALEVYNAKARRLGRKELSYGYWVQAGRPESP